MLTLLLEKSPVALIVATVTPAVVLITSELLFNAPVVLINALVTSIPPRAFITPAQ